MLWFRVGSVKVQDRFREVLGKVRGRFREDSEKVRGILKKNLFESF